MKKKAFVLIIVLLLAAGAVLLIAPKRLAVAKDPIYDEIMSRDENTWTSFDRAYLRGGEEQRSRLRTEGKMYKEQFGTVGDYTRLIRRVFGELPEDQPRLTQEQVFTIVDTLKAQKEKLNYTEAAGQFLKMLDEVAGAPDFEGGSGDSYRIYAFTDDLSSYAYVMDGVLGVIIWNRGEKTDYRVVEPW